MKINKAKLKSFTGARREFFWLDNGETVAIFRFDTTGTPTDTSKIKAYMARAEWKTLVKEGWTRFGRTLQLPIHTLSPNERALVDYLH